MPRGELRPAEMHSWQLVRRDVYESNMTYDYGYELMSCMSLFDPWRYLLPSRISVLRTLVGVFRTIWTSLPSESLSEDLRLKVE